MLYSYTGGRNLYGQLTNDTSSGNLTNGDSYINMDISQTLGLRSWPFLYQEATLSTVASQQFIVIPQKFRKVKSVKVAVGTTLITPKEAPNRDFWDRLNSSTSVTSDFPDWYYIFNGRCHFYPTPGTISTVTLFGRIGFDRLNIADYTTGSILTTTSGSTSIIGSSTGWHSGMVGRFVRVTDTGEPNKGDDEWYEVASVTSGTQLVLLKPYRGLDISSGTAAYAIGQISPIPDGYQEAPIYWGAYLYYSSKTDGEPKASQFKSMHDTLINQLIADHGSSTDNILVEDESLDEQINPNLTVRL